jgi:AP-3 complex subunit delta-1
LPDIVKKLLLQLLPDDDDENTNSARPTKSRLASDATYNSEVISRILSMCSRNTYEMVADFAWYISVLLALVRVPRVSAGNEIAAQLVDVAVRVRNVREFAVKEMEKLLADSTLLESAVLEDNNAGVLFAAAWIVGEYSRYVLDVSICIRESLIWPLV